jgi:hypothetical protein
MPFYSEATLKTMKCRECGEHMIEQTGRGTLYCIDCDTCPTCGCADADGFRHFVGCAKGNKEVWQANNVTGEEAPKFKS